MAENLIVSAGRSVEHQQYSSSRASISVLDNANGCVDDRTVSCQSLLYLATPHEESNEHHDRRQQENRQKAESDPTKPFQNLQHHVLQFRRRSPTQVVVSCCSVDARHH